MKPYRVEVSALDGPSGLRRAPLESPTPNAGEVAIAVHAVGVNFFDILITQGRYQRRPALPFAPGAEVAGEVVAVGANVNVALGARVLALLEHGGYASHVVVPAERVFPIPDAMGYESAAALGIVYQTSYFGLVHRAGLQPGETLLVHAAAGGVGLAAVQLGKALGARVVGTAGSDEKLDVVRAQGADAAFTYRTDAWVDEVSHFTDGRGADVIYDPVGGDAFDLSTKCIAFDGRLVVVGFASGRIPTLGMNRVLLKNIAVTGLHWGAYFEHAPELIADAHEALLDLFADGAIDPVVSETFPLERAEEALDRLAARKTTGKLVLIP